MAGTTSTPAKKFRSKFFRVAVEGATTDGRQIERQWLVDAAETYNPNTFGARVWIEHMRSLLPDSPFRAYGDVVALKTEEVEIAGTKKLGLFAQIDPTPDLVAMNKARQKLYTSIEIRPKFADTGRAYLDGLAVTDTPASLGTEMLTFSAQNPDANPLKARKTNPENLFSEAIEIELEFEEVTDQPSAFAALKAKVGELLNKGKDKEGKDAATFSELGESLDGLLTVVTQQVEASEKSNTALAALQGQFTSLQTELVALKTKLGETEDHSHKPRPPVSGGNQHVVTDC